MKHLYYLGGAYTAIWILLFFYARRLSVRSNALTKRVEELEKIAGGKGAA